MFQKKIYSIVSKPTDIRWIEMVLNHTEKSGIALYNIQFSMNIKMDNHRIKNSFLVCAKKWFYICTFLYQPKAVNNTMQ